MSFRSDLRLRALAAAAALAVGFGGAASAQMSFDEGSFSEGAAASADDGGASTGGGWPAAPGDGFGGSFEEPAGDASATEAAPETGFGGSFEEADSAAATDGATQPETSEATGPEDGAQEDAEAADRGEAAETAAADETAPPPEDTAASGPEPAVAEDDPILAFETRDFDVPPTIWLRSSAFHAATPVSIPGGLVITTEELAEELVSGDTPFVVVDVLGGEYTLPNAWPAPALAAAGTFNDRTQQQASIWLAQVTGGNSDVPIVLYCSDPMCWLSYNAALRTIAAGYTNVYWYRGGLQAWQMAGLPVYPSGF